MTNERNENWLERSLRSASAEVATWPEWKKKAMRVLPDPPTDAGLTAEPSPAVSTRSRNEPRPLKEQSPPQGNATGQLTTTDSSG